jgi:hypothetical protein
VPRFEGAKGEEKTMTKNHIELIGFAGQAPKRTGTGDKAPVKLSLATTDRWRDASGGLCPVKWCVKVSRVLCRFSPSFP